MKLRNKKKRIIGFVFYIYIILFAFLHIVSINMVTKITISSDGLQ